VAGLGQAFLEADDVGGIAVAGTDVAMTEKNGILMGSILC
jgi:hypothetical protein